MRSLRCFDRTLDVAIRRDTGAGQSQRHALADGATFDAKAPSRGRSLIIQTSAQHRQDIRVALIVAAVVPVSQRAVQALQRLGNGRWARPLSQVPCTMASAVREHGEAEDAVLMHDLAFHSSAGMSFGTRHTSTVQLPGESEADYLTLAFDTGSLSLTNTASNTFLASSPADAGFELAQDIQRP